MAPGHGELDFEYPPSGGWGEPANVLIRDLVGSAPLLRRGGGHHVYFAKGRVLAPDRVNAEVAAYRGAGADHPDTVP